MKSHPRSFETSATPEASSHRQARLERILLEELQALLRDEAQDPALEGIQLVRIELAPDGGHARLAYVVEGPLEEEGRTRSRTQAALVRATGFLRSRLASQLNLKRLPKLTFTFLGAVEGGGAWHG